MRNVLGQNSNAPSEARSNETHFLLILCGTLLVVSCKKKEPEGANESAARQNGLIPMSISAQQHVGLVVAPATLTRMKEYLHATGTVQPIDSRIASVRPFARGRVVEVRVKVGDRISTGQILAVFDNLEVGDLITQLQSIRSTQEEIKARLVPARREVERSRRLADIGAGAEKDAESALAKQKEIEAGLRAHQATAQGMEVRLRRFGASTNNGNHMTVRKAPFAGVVVKASVSVGDLVDESREVFSVADLSRLWVQAEVYEKDLSHIRVGQDARIHVDTYPNETFSGHVTYISDVLDPQTRTARVRCELANPKFKLKTDIFASIELPRNFDKQAISIHTSALQWIDGKTVVFLRRAQTQFEKREMESGVSMNGQTEILHGLNAGAPVVTQGSFHLKSILAGGELGEE
jgi:cobalt-zinc-cadmium efflux system membrane fusion protein